jgi:hypothetical protein
MGAPGTAAPSGAALALLLATGAPGVAFVTVVVVVVVFVVVLLVELLAAGKLQAAKPTSAASAVATAPQRAAALSESRSVMEAPRAFRRTCSGG